MSLNQKISNLRMKQYNLELQNSKIGIASRQDINALPVPLKQVDKELIDEYNSQFPDGFIKEGKTLLYDIKNPPELDDIGDLAKVYDDLDKNINELIDELNFLEIELVNNIEAQKVLKENTNQSNYLFVIRELKKLKNDYNTIKKEIAKAKGYLSRVYELKKIDVNNRLENNAKIDLISKNNTDKIRQYQEELLVMNAGNMNLKKQSNESEEQYLERLQQNAEIEVTDTKLQNAKQFTMRKFREKMKELTRNEVLIEQVSNRVDYDTTSNVTNRLEILKRFEDFKNKFLTIYGFDNKFISDEDIIEFIKLFLLNYDTSVLLEQKTKNINIKKKSTLLDSTLQKPNISIEEGGFGGIIIISNKTGNKVFLGISKDIKGKRITLYSPSGKENTYSSIPLANAKNVKQIITNIAEELDISYNEFIKIFGASSTTIAEQLYKQNLIKTHPYKKVIDDSNKTSENTYGYGINEIDLPKIAKFGKIFINAHKLYYNNILSPTLQNGNHILGFKNIKVSDKFVDILINMIKGTSPSHFDINLLPHIEKQVYDKLIHLAGLHRTYPNNSDETISAYKKRLKLLEAEINMGNNNPEIKNEMYEIIHSLHNFGMITNSQKKQYLTQL